MTDVHPQSRVRADPFRVILLDPTLEQPAAELLARAFFEDPLLLYYLPDCDQRSRILPGFMRVSLRYCLTYGEVWTTPALDGVACWLPPGKTGFDLWGFIRTGIGVAPLTMGLSVLLRVRAVERDADRFHHAVMPGPHCYLMLLGVDPGRQGQGVGSRLIAPQIAQAKLANLPCYLETMTERDVAFYRKNGFTIADEITLSPSGLHIWAMTTSEPHS
jgi:ribosomal protein S18 acetylase RimI-like enzyme